MGRLRAPIALLTGSLMSVAMTWPAAGFAAPSPRAIVLGEEPGVPTLGDPEAQAHLERGTAYFYEKNFEQASTEFKAAYAIEPAPFLLYSWAQAERYEGNCVRAVELYNRFLASRPPADKADAARERIVGCEGTVIEPPPLDEVPPPVEQPPEEGAGEGPSEGPSEEPSEGAVERPPVGPAIILGSIAIAVGGAMAGGGAFAIFDGRSRRDGAQQTMSQQRFLDEVQTGTTRQRVGVALVGVGSAVAVTGIVVLAVGLVRRARPRTPAHTAARGLAPRLRF